ncbi:MAG: HEAT repeat domain-containing protein [Candidatus Aminicenantes bacterium]|nr:HEAT repeat domain-containing protein [Candidatus Aminicenantes bacterium]
MKRLKPKIRAAKQKIANFFIYSMVVSAFLFSVFSCSEEKPAPAGDKTKAVTRIHRKSRFRKSELDDVIFKYLKEFKDPADSWHQVLNNIHYKDIMYQKKYLSEQLESPDIRLQFKAAELLMRANSYGGVPVLRRAAFDKKNPYNQQAQTILKNLLNNLADIFDNYRTENSDRIILLETLIRSQTPRNEKWLHQLLVSDNHSIQKKLSSIIEKNPDSTWIDFFLKELSEADQHAENKYKLMYILMNSRSPQIENALIARLQDYAPWIREMAVKGLGKIRSRNGVKTLCECLHDNEFWVRTSVAWALGNIGDSGAVEPLISALSDEVWMVRVESARALGKIADKSAEVALLNCISDTDPTVRLEAAKALEKLGWAPQSDDERTRHLIAKRNWRNLKKIGVAAVPQLVEALNWEDGSCRKEIIDLLTLCHTAEANAGIQKSTIDKNRSVRETANAARRKLGLPIYTEESNPTFFKRKNIKKRVRYLSDFISGIADKMSALYNPSYLDPKSLPQFSKFSFVEVKDFNFLNNQIEYKIKFSDVNYDLFNKYAFNYSQDKKMCFYYECASYRINGASIHVSAGDVDFGFGLFDFKLGFGQRICFVGPSTSLNEYWIDNRIFTVLTSSQFLVANQKQITYFLEIYCIEENAVFSFRSPAYPFKYKEGTKF